jgi:hypothetical protein
MRPGLQAFFLAALAAFATSDLAAPSIGASPLECTPREDCCKICRKGRACGNTCIRADYQCHKGRGCACDQEDVCP